MVTLRQKTRVRVSELCFEGVSDFSFMSFYFYKCRVKKFQTNFKLFLFSASKNRSVVYIQSTGLQIPLSVDMIFL